MFIAEAPGRLGADQTGIPLFGDRTGDNFEDLIGSVGWHRGDLFVTNAVLCNPRSEDGTNDRPTKDELRACSSFLRMQIELVQPKVVATLGTTALQALATIHPHPYQLAQHVANPLPWAGRNLFPLYHPSPLATCHRSTQEQLADFAKLHGLVSEWERSETAVGGPAEVEPTRFQQLVAAIVGYAGRISYFKLTKLLYLSEWKALDTLGNTISDEVYVRANDGPWPPCLNDVVSQMDGHEISRLRSRGDLEVSLGPSPRFEPALPVEHLEIVLQVVEKHAGSDKEKIKLAAYLTQPMRAILRREKIAGGKENGVPVLYRGTCVADES